MTGKKEEMPQTERNLGEEIESFNEIVEDDRL